MFKHKPNEQQVERFFYYVSRRGDDECWLWEGTRDKHGYGIYSVNSILYKAHRAMYYFYYGEFDTSLMCCHSCDNPSCVNPHHLWLGTQRENSLDRHRKGRTRTGHLFGEDNPSAKLTSNDVLWIRENYNPKVWSTRKLAKKFKVSQTKIRQILNREAWKHI